MNASSTFWSRRRAAVAAEEQAEQAALDQDAHKAELALREEQTDAEILAELDLPDPDTLRPGDDIVRFMARAVPERIRQRALRKLWRRNPVLANLDGLNDYDGDFTGVSTDPVLTTYQVGKGLMAHLQEMARQAIEDEPVPVETPTEPEPVIAVAEPLEPEPEPEPEIRQPRRMRFSHPEGQA